MMSVSSKKTIIIVVLALGYLPVLFHFNKQTKEAAAVDEELDLKKSRVDRFVRSEQNIQPNRRASRVVREVEATTNVVKNNNVTSKISDSSAGALNFIHYQFEAQKEELRASYREKFAEIDISEASLEAVILQASQIEKSRLEAQALLDEVEFQKGDYDHLLKKILKEEDYENYRAVEKAETSKRYIDDLDQYVNSAELSSLTDPEKEELIQLIDGIGGGVTVDQSIGPYGSPVSIKNSIFEEGTEQLFKDDQLSLINGEYNYLLEKVSTENLKAAINGYYNDRINSYVAP